ncbi:shikimate dehydrogenase [Mangrovibrevibacter kandeliae]|uniref:shikimate dehydrogenase n=1 Tax=Mangrovibrevibacter kandeliae TaxID=2968473 RepID=UPI002118E854|nr:shikimate dehydrogenase [Aurantimonas sp. CSK15Z-1]MCQ8782951.1 shikimate dehydrogenase [Aurantimonas sp. CSK15Z-1]
MTRTPFDALGTPATVLVGLIGAGIQLSRSAAMHEAEGAAQGLRLVYRLLDADRMDPVPPIAELLRAAELCGFAGLNITFPYKLAVTEHLDSLSDDAQALGAVNTVVFRDGLRLGFNTDLGGFSDSFAAEMAGVPRRDVLQIGAGGAGLAVAFALLDNGVEHLAVHDLDRPRAETLVATIAKRYGRDRVSLAADVDGRFDGVVNATPMGMAKLPGSPYPVDRLTPDMWVADVIYFPLETELVRAAKALGCRAIGGAGMAVGQAVRAFRHFTGRDADPARMRARFEALGDDGGAAPIA